MITEVYINDLLFDLQEDTTVAASYGNISFGELTKRKGVKSNVFEGPFSNRNKLIFESCEVAGSYSVLPYRRATIRVEIGGVVCFEGFCTLEEAQEGYQVQSYAGASDFYSIITNAKLPALDLSEWSHVWNETNISNSWANIEGYIYAFVEYGKEIPGPIMPEYLLPQLYFHTLIKQIATDAGYSLQGDVLTNGRFLKQVLIPNTFPLAISYGGTWDLATLLPDLAQSKLWLDFANIYGLQFDINDVTKEIRANYVDDILFSEPEVWTTKVDRTEKRKTSYRFKDYGQSSYLKFKSESVTEANSCYQDFQKAIAIDDTTLQLEADVYKSEFFLIQDVDPVLFPDGRATTRTYVAKAGKAFLGIWDVATAYNESENGSVWYNGSYYKPIADSTGDEPASSPLSWTPIPEKDIWDTKSRPMYGILTIDVSSLIEVALTTPETVTKIINNTGMSWEETYPLHYRIFDRILKRTKVVEQLIKLNWSDISQLDFTRAKNIENELYLLQEVKQFKLNEQDSTIVELVRI